ncbi:MAG: transketolase [Vicinamibacterales bacterium]
MQTTTPDFTALTRTAAEIRGTVIDMCHRAGTAHLASCLSCIDLLTAIYWHAARVDPSRHKAPERDRVILSKGHAAMALFATLAKRGFFDPSVLDTYCLDGSALAEHPSLDCVPGVEASTGSLGHGLSFGLGTVLGERIQGRDIRAYVVMSDGECNEGSSWEAALYAPAQKVSGLVALVDYNKWQATGRSEEVTSLRPLAAKWAAFGWRTLEIDGHDMKAIVGALDQVPDGDGRPTAIIAHTVKGKGVSFMEDDNNWHYRAPTADEVVRARQELGLA